MFTPSAFPLHRVRYQAGIAQGCRNVAVLLVVYIQSTCTATCQHVLTYAAFRPYSTVTSTCRTRGRQDMRENAILNATYTHNHRPPLTTTAASSVRTRSFSPSTNSAEAREQPNRRRVSHARSVYSLHGYKHSTIFPRQALPLNRVEQTIDRTDGRKS